MKKKAITKSVKKKVLKKTPIKKKVTKVQRLKKILSNPVLTDRVIDISGARIIEHSPTYRSISFYNSRTRFLYFPYVVHIIREHTTHGGHKEHSLHVGFRMKPLPKYKKDIRESVFLYPTLSNIYAKWLLCCSPASIEGFWHSPFYFDGGWAEHTLRNVVGLSYSSWEEIHPDDFMDKLSKWPKTIKYSYSEQGLHNWGTAMSNMMCHIPFKTIMGDIHRSAKQHVFDQNWKKPRR